MRHRSLAAAAAIGLGGGLAALAAGAAGLPGTAGALDWRMSSRALLLAGFLLPAMAHLHVHVLGLVGRPHAAEGRTRRLAALLASGAALLFLGHLLQPSGAFALVAFAGALALAAAGVLQAATVMPLLPGRGASVVDTARDPLTKGDDACLKHVRLAHVFLPLGLLLLAAAYAPGVLAQAQSNLRLAGLHVLLLGYGALSLYGLGHLVVPRLSGVPAIAAGAIKGELHSTLLGLVLLAAGFLLDGVAVAGGHPARGLRVAGGAFAFLGVFTYMGVLGANIMKRKSATQRVTPEFVYVPWTFTGIFWLVAGLLLGLFLNAVPDIYAARRPALRLAHADGLLLGAFAQLWLGWLLRLRAREDGRAPPTFQATRWAFFAYNAGLALLVVDGFRAGGAGGLALAGALLALLAVAGCFKTLAPSGRGQGEGSP